MLLSGCQCVWSRRWWRDRLATLPPPLLLLPPFSLLFDCRPDTEHASRPTTVEPTEEMIVARIILSHQRIDYGDLYRTHTHTHTCSHTLFIQTPGHSRTGLCVGLKLNCSEDMIVNLGDIERARRAAEKHNRHRLREWRNFFKSYFSAHFNFVWKTFLARVFARRHFEMKMSIVCQTIPIKLIIFYRKLLIIWFIYYYLLIWLKQCHFTPNEIWINSFSKRSKESLQSVAHYWLRSRNRRKQDWRLTETRQTGGGEWRESDQDARVCGSPWRIDSRNSKCGARSTARFRARNLQLVK